MTVVLSTIAKLETNPLRKYIYLNLLRYAKLMEWLPFENVNSLRSVAVRWNTLPDVAFRKINGSYTPSEGDVEQVWEAVYAMGGEIRFDRVFEKLGNLIVDPKRMNTDMKTAALGMYFNHYLINGDHALNPNGFEGLKKRVANMPARQSVAFAAAAGAALNPTSSVANGNIFFNQLEQMAVRTGSTGEARNVTAWLCNEGLKWGIGRVARYIQASGGNFLSTAKDSFDRDIPTLFGAPIIDVGLQKDQATEIITDTEVAGDAHTDATSIYSVTFSTDDGITGIQLSPMEIYDPLSGGELHDAPAKLVRLEWWLGLANFGSHGIVRGYNLHSVPNWS